MKYGAIVTGRQAMALQLRKSGHSVGSIARHLDISRVAASRLLSRGRQNIRQFNLICAVGGDPITAIDEVRKVLAI